MEDEGHVIPELQNKPDLFDSAIPYLNAFHALSTSRQIGFGIGFIPYSEIYTYLNENNIYDIDDREDYYHFIKFIDVIYVQISNSKK